MESMYYLQSMERREALRKLEKKLKKLDLARQELESTRNQLYLTAKYWYLRSRLSEIIIEGLSPFNPDKEETNG